MLPPPILAWKGGVSKVGVIASLIITVAGGVICHYIIKWLDGNDK